MEKKETTVQNADQTTSTTDKEDIPFPIQFTEKEIKAMKKAKVMGLDTILEKLFMYIGTVEARFKIIQEAIPDPQKVANEIAASLKRQMMQSAPAMRGGAAPQLSGAAGGADVTQLMRFMSMFRGEDDNPYKQLALESMKENISLARAMKNAIIARMGSETVKKVLPNV